MSKERYICGAVYCGPHKHLRGKTAIVRIDGNGELRAQFDDPTLTVKCDCCDDVIQLGYDWTAIPREHFEGVEDGDIKGETSGTLQ